MKSKLLVCIAACTAACTEPPIELTHARSQVLLQAATGSTALDFDIWVPVDATLEMADIDRTIWISRASKLAVRVGVPPKVQSAPTLEVPCGALLEGLPPRIVVQRRDTPRGVQVLCQDIQPRGDTLAYFVVRLERDGNALLECDISLGAAPSSRARATAMEICGSLRIRGRTTWVLFKSPFATAPASR